MNKKILCVDDDPNVLAGLERQLFETVEADVACGAVVEQDIILPIAEQITGTSDNIGRVGGADALPRRAAIDDIRAVEEVCIEAGVAA